MTVGCPALRCKGTCSLSAPLDGHVSALQSSSQQSTLHHHPPPTLWGRKLPRGGEGGLWLADSIVGNSLFQRQTPNSSPDLPLTLQSQLPRVQNGHTSGLPGGIVV